MDVRTLLSLASMLRKQSAKASAFGLMRIRVIHKPSVSVVDGIRLDVFQPGVLYEMGTTLASVFLAEGWGAPVQSDEPAIVIPLHGARVESSPQPNLVREFSPRELPPALAADRRRRPRRR